jgi:hypothetical protein
MPSLQIVEKMKDPPGYRGGLSDLWEEELSPVCYW